jgi:hypothetical protein
VEGGVTGLVPDVSSSISAVATTRVSVRKQRPLFRPGEAEALRIVFFMSVAPLQRLSSAAILLRDHYVLNSLAVRSLEHEGRVSCPALFALMQELFLNPVIDQKRCWPGNLSIAHVLFTLFTYALS